MTIIRARRGTTAQWATANPVLSSGELGYDTTTGDFKIGNGANTWDGVQGIQAMIAASHPSVILPEPSGADDSTIINTIAAANPGKALSFRAKRTYIINNTINTTAPVYGNMAEVDCTAMANGTALGQRYAIRAQGTLGSALAVSVARAEKDKQITGISSTTTLAVGDMVLIANAEQPVPGMVRTDRMKGELNTIKTKDSATAVTLKSGLLQQMGASTLTIQKVTPIEGFFVEHLRFRMRGVGSAHNAVEVQYGKDAQVRNCTIDGAEDCAVGFKMVLSGIIEGNTIKNSTSSGTLGSTGYGICIWDASRHVTVRNNYIEDSRHHIAGGGIYPPVFVNVVENHGRVSTSASFDCHESCMYWFFIRNTAEVGTHGMFLRGQHIYAEGNIIREMSNEMIGVHLWDDVTEQHDIKLIRNEGYNCGYGISVGKTGSEFEHISYDIEVTGNILVDCGVNPIRIRNVRGALVNMNEIDGGTAAAILIEGLSQDVQSTDITALRNKIKNHGTIGIHCKFFDGAKLSGNEIDGGTAESILVEGGATTKSVDLRMGDNDSRNAGTYGFRIANVNDVLEMGGTVSDSGTIGLSLLNTPGVKVTTLVRRPGTYGILADGSGSGSYKFVGADVSGGTNGTYDALRIQNCASANVTGGYFASARYGIFSTSTAKLGVVGAHVSDTTHATKVNQDAGAGYVSAALL